MSALQNSLCLLPPRSQQSGAIQKEARGEEERAGGQTGRAQSCQRSSKTGCTKAGLMGMQRERERDVRMEKEHHGDPLMEG